MIQAAPGSYRLAFASPPESTPKPYTQEPVAGFRTVLGVNMGFASDGNQLLLGPIGPQNTFWSIPMNGDAPITGALYSSDAFSSGGGTVVPGNRMVIAAGQQLALVDPMAGQRRKITMSSSDFLFPAVAPDGTTLAFSTGRARYDLIEVALDGSAPRDVIATTRDEKASAWSPDGTRFAYATNRNGAEEIWLRNRADGSERLIVDAQRFPGKGFLDMAMSPDGSRLAYRVQSEGQFEIWISPLTGEAPVAMWADPAHAPQRTPSWSPDGNSLAFYAVREGKTAVMRFEVGSTAAPVVLAFMQRPNPVRWSPRGDWILYRNADTLRVVSPDGKQDRVVSQSLWEIFGWSKDGARVVGVVRDAGRRLSLQQIDAATWKESRIADLGPVTPEFDLADSINQFGYRGFSLHPDGKSFLTSVLRMQTDIQIMKDFDKPERWLDRLVRFQLH